MGPSFIATGGIIGAGKSELAGALGKRLGFAVLYEPVATNPYLDLFYQDKLPHAMKMQVMLISARFKLIREHMKAHHQAVPTNLILDRTMYEDPVFEEILHDEGSINELDHETYRDYIRWVLLDQAPTPDVILYLKVSPEKALERIHRRGRSCERSMPLDYLRRLAAGYDKLFADLKHRMPVAEIDWNTDVEPGSAAYVEQVERLVWLAKDAHHRFSDNRTVLSAEEMTRIRRPVSAALS